MLAQKPDNPHIVVINSALFNLMDMEELKFVIGHELGHIIGRDLVIRRLLHYVYPPQTTALPLALGYKVRLFDQLAELVADRYGFLACESLDSCVTAFFKMESGLNLQNLDINVSDLLNDTNRRLRYYKEGNGMSRYDHPENPIRVQAIYVYATSNSQDELETRMSDVITLLHKVGDSPINEPLTLFFATAGLIVSSVDGKFDPSERESIIRQLASTNMYPLSVLEDVESLPVEKLNEVFNFSINSILKYDPNLRTELLAYMIQLAIVDKELHEKEINFIYGLGRNMDLTIKEISRIFADMIQRSYVPSLHSIC